MGDDLEKPVAIGGAPVRVGLALCSIPMLVLFAWPMGLTTQARDATSDLHRSIHLDATQVTLASEPSTLQEPPSGAQLDDDAYPYP
jgi:hypothetical protein